MSSTRRRVLALYKELHRLGRDYPDPNFDFNGRMRRMFDKNRSLTDPADIEQALRLGEYIKNETLALYSLRKYRYLKQHYDSTALTSIAVASIEIIPRASKNCDAINLNTPYISSVPHDTYKA